ncbi:thioredoxin-like protein [Apodospora peruviana]|uniref:thioredoxin-dependent peroxiredoxin n=1 Tax=Apodospora peruviana TaxID=516989 RepID=A0AAE0IIV5_9PEZI|nr:thioredoxin-like protein [Apodospora peruviana]
MPVELRKRKAPAAPPPAAPPKKKQSTVAKAASNVKEAVKETAAKATKATASAGATANGAAAKSATNAVKPSVGDVLSLHDFGGEIETNEGAKTTLEALVDESKAGVVLFTYPKASTPGCTKQACLFRDAYTPLTASGLAIYGLSTDSPKANTTFKDKQKLPYPLLCDPKATLIGAIGLKKLPKGTQRGVFVVSKAGKVLAAEPGGPDATVNVVKKIVDNLGGDGGAVAAAAAPAADDAKKEEAVTEYKEEGESPLPTSAEVEAAIATETAAAVPLPGKDEEEKPAAVEEKVNGEAKADEAVVPEKKTEDSEIKDA